MITGMKGKISSAEVSRIVLEVRDIFYEIWISFKTFEIIGSQKNRDIFIHIFHLKNERTEKLFGFMEKEERDMFELMRSLPGIGEMTALRVLSFLTPKEIILCAMEGNPERLEKIPKVKGKTSEKILFEVKQNLKKFQVFLEGPDRSAEKMTGIDPAVLALIQLGFEEKAAEKEYKKAKDKGISDTSEIIREVLKNT